MNLDEHILTPWRTTATILIAVAALHAAVAAILGIEAAVLMLFTLLLGGGCIAVLAHAKVDGRRDSSQNAPNCDDEPGGLEWVYIGCIIEGDYTVGYGAVTAEDPVIRSEQPLPMSSHALAVSPGEYRWGYVGSGPSALSHSLLAHAAGERLAYAAYGIFTQDVVARWGPRWAIKQSDVVKWLGERVAL